MIRSFAKFFGWLNQDRLFFQVMGFVAGIIIVYIWLWVFDITIEFFREDKVWGGFDYIEVVILSLLHFIAAWFLFSFAALAFAPNDSYWLRLCSGHADVIDGADLGGFVFIILLFIIVFIAAIPITVILKLLGIKGYAISQDK